MDLVMKEMSVSRVWTPACPSDKWLIINAGPIHH